MHSPYHAAAAAELLQSCLTLCDPRDSSHQAPPSLGFSRQEYWNGLPFPSPMQESEKWKWSCSVMSNSWRPHGLQPTRLCRSWDFPGNSTRVGCHCLFHMATAAAAAKSLQSCLTLCDPIDGSSPRSPVPGTLQARTLEWVAISFSNVWKWKVKVKSLSRVWLLATPWTAAYQAPPPMGISRQEYWSGLPLPSPRFLLEGSNQLLLRYVTFTVTIWEKHKPKKVLFF